MWGIRRPLHLLVFIDNNFTYLAHKDSVSEYAVRFPSLSASELWRRNDGVKCNHITNTRRFQTAFSVWPLARSYAASIHHGHLNSVLFYRRSNIKIRTRTVKFAWQQIWCPPHSQAQARGKERALGGDLGCSCCQNVQSFLSDLDWSMIIISKFEVNPSGRLIRTVHTLKYWCGGHITIREITTHSTS
jgi:hypothetical protein